MERRRRRRQQPQKCSFVIIASALLAASYFTTSVIAEEVHVAHDNNIVNTRQCDEIKCTTLVPGLLPGFIGYMCWSFVGSVGDSITNITIAEAAYPCANGLEGRPLTSMEPVPYDIYLFQYYTCCPEEYNGPLLQHCSTDSCTSPDGTFGGTDCWANAATEPISCSADNEYKYPRTTAGTGEYWSKWYTQYTCCDTGDGTPPVRDDIKLYESIRIVLSGTALLYAVIFLAAVLSSPARTQAFNLYVIFLTVPDALLHIVAVTVGINTLTGRQTNCTFMYFFAYFASTANNWLNGVISHQIYVILRNSKMRKRTNPPTKLGVTKHVAAVYLYSACLGAWGIIARCGLSQSLNAWNASHLPLATFLSWTAIIVPPGLYLIYVSIRVWRGNLLPKEGQTRVISVFFFRLIIAFVIFYIPILVLIIVEKESHNELTHYFIWWLGSLQGITSLIVATRKPDLRKAVLTFLRCKHCRDRREPGSYRDELGMTRESRWSMFQSQRSSSLMIRGSLLGMSLRSSIRESGRRASSLSQLKLIRGISRNFCKQDSGGEEAPTSTAISSSRNNEEVEQNKPPSKREKRTIKYEENFDIEKPTDSLQASSSTHDGDADTNNGGGISIVDLNELRMKCESDANEKHGNDESEAERDRRISRIRESLIYSEDDEEIGGKEKRSRSSKRESNGSYA